MVDPRTILPVPQYDPNKIPGKATLPPIKEDLEDILLLISFEYYNNKLCEMSVLSKNGGRAAIEAVKRIGQSTRRSLYSNGIQSKPVNNAGDYKKLFNGLPPDTNMKEHKIQGTSRLFYFFERATIFHVVAVTNRHFETDKHK